MSSNPGSDDIEISPPLKGSKLKAHEREELARRVAEHGKQALQTSLLTKTQGSVRDHSFSRILHPKGAAMSMGRLGIVPDRVKVLFRYGHNAVSTVSSGATERTYRNSLYDPEVAVGGNQPNGYDQWSAFYSKFLVTKMRMVVKVTGYGTLDVANIHRPLTGTIVTSTSSTGPTSLAVALGYPGVVWGKGGNPYRPVLELDTGWRDLPDWFGISYEEMRSDDTYWGSSSADPSKQLYLHWTIANNSNASWDMDYTIQMLYEAELFDRVALAQS